MSGWDAKSPGSEVDYAITAGDRLNAGEELQTVTWHPVDGIEMYDPSIVDYTDENGVAHTKGKAVTWIRGGTEGDKYPIPVTLITNQNRRWDVVCVLSVKTEKLKS